MALDAVTLAKSGLADPRYASLKQSVAVEQLWRASMRLLTTLSQSFLPGGGGGPGAVDPPPDGPTRDRWRRRYFAALRRLRQADIQTVEDENLGAEVYVSLRARWDPYVAAIGRYMAYDARDVDPAGTAPESTEDRRAFQARSHAAGGLTSKSSDFLSCTFLENGG